MKSVIYCRVSTKSQTGVSLDAQKFACTRYCAERGYSSGHVVSEICSAYRTKPPILHCLLKQRKTRLIVYRVDRLCRNMADLNVIKNFIMRGNWIHIVSSDLVLNKSLWFTNLDAFIALIKSAEAECVAISERVRNSLEYLQRSGLTKAKVAPYGYRIVGRSGVYNRIEEEKKEQLVIGYIRNMASGAVDAGIDCLRGVVDRRRIDLECWTSSLTGMCSVLNKLGVLRRGKKWNSSAVNSIIRGRVDSVQNMIGSLRL